MKVFQYLLILIFASTLTIEAIPTKLVVRAKASDAKFIGSSMGGALVIIRDSETSQILAKGFTSGTTGNTQKIMRAPVERYKRITDEPTAKFEAVIEINEPTLISIEVLSPYAQKQAITKNSKEIWLIPGKDIVGDGIIIEVNGFALDILTPRAHQHVKMGRGEATIPISINLVMM